MKDGVVRTEDSGWGCLQIPFALEVLALLYSLENGQSLESEAKIGI